MVIEPNEDPPDADAAYAHYLETCRGLGVEPVPRDRAHDLSAEWSDAIARGGVPPTKH